MQSSLLDLPHDLLVLLPGFLHNIEDFTSLSSSCRLFHTLYDSTSPKTIFRLAAASSRVFFRPSPHFLIAGTAHSLATWAEKSDENTKTLREALEGGMKGLMDLCVERSAGLTMPDIRRMQEMRFSTINPLVDLIDKCVGVQWYSTPNFWEGGVDDAWTISSDPPELFFQLVIYGELFRDSLMASLEPSKGRPQSGLDVDVRLDFIKYCVPEDACYMCAKSAMDVRLVDGTIDPRRAVKEVGPYVTGYRLVRTHQLSLRHCLQSTRWEHAWRPVREAAGGDFEAGSWKQGLWESVCVLQGTEGMGMILPGGAERWMSRLVEWRRKIEKLTENPGQVVVGRQKTYVFPFPTGDVDITTSGYVLGT